MITNFKIFENNTIEQQPFYLTGSRLYISDNFSHSITPTLEELHKKSGNTKYIDYIYQNQLDFYNKKKNEKGWLLSTRLNTDISVTYKRMYKMNIVIYHGNQYNNRFGKFQYYIGGNSGDHEMRGKNMVRATKECNLNFMKKFYPIIENISDFYKKFEIGDKGFFDIIIEELIKDPKIAKNGVPEELEKEFGYLYMANQYNL